MLEHAWRDEAPDFARSRSTSGEPTAIPGLRFSDVRRKTRLYWPFARRSELLRMPPNPSKAAAEHAAVHAGAADEQQRQIVLASFALAVGIVGSSRLIRVSPGEPPTTSDRNASVWPTPSRRLSWMTCRRSPVFQTRARHDDEVDRSVGTRATWKSCESARSTTRARVGARVSRETSAPLLRQRARERQHAQGKWSSASRRFERERREVDVTANDMGTLQNSPPACKIGFERRTFPFTARRMRGREGADFVRARRALILGCAASVMSGAILDSRQACALRRARVRWWMASAAIGALACAPPSHVATTARRRTARAPMPVVDPIQWRRRRR